MNNLYEEFVNWLEYNFPAIKYTPFQQEVLRTVLETGVPRTNAELKQRLKDLLPKPRK